MRELQLNHPCTTSSPRLARLTRHLEARLLDFGPGGPQVTCRDENRGLVSARFPGHNSTQVRSALESFGVYPAQEGEDILFFLNDSLPFEALDSLWGLLFEIL